MTDLTPEVRAEAIEAAKSVLWSRAEESAPRVVDAVVSAVAPEIARPLQARIEELEDRELRLQDQAGEMAEELTFLRGEAALIERDEARVELLTAALTSVLKHFHPREGSGVQALSLANARAALAAGVTETEAP